MTPYCAVKYCALDSLAMEEIPDYPVVATCQRCGQLHDPDVDKRTGLDWRCRNCGAKTRHPPTL